MKDIPWFLNPLVNISLTVIVSTELFIIYNMTGWAFDEELGKC